MGRGRELVFDRRFRGGHLLYIGGHTERPNRSDAVVGEEVLRMKDHADALGDIDHTRSDFRFRKSLLVKDMLIVMKCDLFAPLVSFESCRTYQ